MLFLLLTSRINNNNCSIQYRYTQFVFVCHFHYGKIFTIIIAPRQKPQVIATNGSFGVPQYACSVKCFGEKREIGRECHNNCVVWMFYWITNKDYNEDSGRKHIKGKSMDACCSSYKKENLLKPFRFLGEVPAKVLGISTFPWIIYHDSFSISCFPSLHLIFFYFLMTFIKYGALEYLWNYYLASH